MSLTGISANRLELLQIAEAVAREKSIDKDTNLRAGTLGLVTEEGKTQDEERKVDPALFKAADKLKDGQLLQEPVKVGRNFVLVWKRQTLPPTSRSMAAETPAIRAAIADQRVRVQRDLPRLGA